MNDELMYEHWLIKMVHASQFMISIPNNQCKSPKSVTSIYFFMFGNHYDQCGQNYAVINMNYNNDKTTIRGVLEEDGLVDITMGELEMANNNLD